MPRPMEAMHSRSTLTAASLTRCTRAITRSLLRSRDDVGDEARAQALDLIFENKLTLLETTQLQLVQRRVGREADDHIVEIVVLDLENVQALVDLRHFLFR